MTLSHNYSNMTLFQTHPFLTRSADGDRFVGFIPDLLESLSETLGFSYNITLVRDGKYGTKHPDGTWNGMIGELTRRVC